MPNTWVLVIGMHRSGTSAVAGVLHHLGLQLPVDLMVGGEDNPSHHESRSLTAANEAVLGVLGGSWDSPPVLERGWENHGAVAALTETITAAAAAFPEAAQRRGRTPATPCCCPCGGR